MDNVAPSTVLTNQLQVLTTNLEVDTVTVAI